MAISAKDARKIAENREEFSNLSNQARWQAIKQVQEKGWISMDTQTADRFLNGFHELTKKKLRSNVVDTASLRQLIDRNGLEENDLLFLCMFLLQFNPGASASELEFGGAKERQLGNQLIYSLSAAGYAEPTIRIMAHVFVSSETKPALLKTAQSATVRGQLQELAREGNNFRAMVLEGKIAHQLGDKEYAIKLWWQAMDEAVAASDWIAAQHAVGNIPEPSMSRYDLTELSSPWIELAMALYDRAKPITDPDDPRYRPYWDEFKRVLDIGLERDDPTMYYYAATYYQEFDKDGNFRPTSTWLYCMTKAATSGIPVAAHELGKYYANSGWRYIEDEPPDHLKPTPFDTYPGPGALSTSWSTLKSIFTKTQPVPQYQSEHENLFHTATFPSTPQKRMEFAMRWLNVAISYQYAPAYLEKARFHLTETLWSAAQAPAEALNLDPKRYLYSSAEEKQECEWNDEAREWQPPENAQDPPNPYYSEESAKECLREVFNAHSAVTVRENSIANSRQKSPSGRSEDSMSDFDRDIRLDDKDRSTEVFKFWRYNEVLQMWMGQARELKRQAEGICDERGWDLWDERGALLYRHGIGAVGREVDGMKVGVRTG